MAGIYFHIPFCHKACHYCDFHFSVNRELQSPLVEAMVREVELQRDFLAGAPVETIYFGGGTPSVLTLPQLESLLNEVHKNFRITQHPEITLEANPEDITTELLAALLRLGVNRLSIGIQSLDAQVLHFLNRNHGPLESIRAMQLSREAGFTNINADLMFAIPGRSSVQLETEVRQLLDLQPTHLSTYSLTIEEATALGRWVNQGKFIPPEEDFAYEQMTLVLDLMERSGYRWYEVSNFAKPGYESRHNTGYWKGIPYLGIGPSAHSFNGTQRQYNVANNSLYLKALKQQQIPVTLEALSLADQVNDYLLTSLRTDWGTDLNLVESLGAREFRHQNSSYLEQLVARNLAYPLEQETLVLTRQGRLLADKIALDLFVEQF